MITSQYPIAENVINDIISRIDNITYYGRKDIYQRIAKRYNLEFACGSSRGVIIDKDSGIVIKFPLNHGGIIQNYIENESSYDSDTTDVYESHALYDHTSYILVNPYYQSVKDYIDNEISQLEQNNKEKSYDEFITHIETLLDDNTYQDCKKDLMEKVFNHILDNVDDYDTISDILDSYSYELEYDIENYVNAYYDYWIDCNPSNYGFDENKLIMLDAGIDDGDSLSDILDYRYDDRVYDNTSHIKETEEEEVEV